MFDEPHRGRLDELGEEENICSGVVGGEGGKMTHIIFGEHGEDCGQGGRTSAAGKGKVIK